MPQVNISLDNSTPETLLSTLQNHVEHIDGLTVIIHFKGESISIQNTKIPFPHATMGLILHLNQLLINLNTAQFNVPQGPKN